MKINRVSDEKLAPSWAFASKSLDTYEQEAAAIKKDVDRINVVAADKVDEATLAKECEAIEICAKSNKTYHYNSNWSENDVNHLKEYASAVGLKKEQVKGIDPTPLVNEMKEMEKNVEASNNQMTRTASAKLVLNDPFHFDKLSDTSHMDKAKWQDVKKQANLAEAPSMMSGAVKPLRGGEDFNKANEPKMPSNQNSIRNPDAIKNLVEGKTIDNGARLKAEKQAREEAKIQDKKDWEKKLVAAMTHLDIVPHGCVFPTETMDANPGLNTPSSRMGVFAKFDVNSIPERTEGEMIKQAKQAEKESIQRPVKEKAGFKMEKASVNGISDVFAEQLKKFVR